MRYYELEALVVAWAEQKGILKNGTPSAQWDKTLEEVNELGEAIEKNDIDETIDALGDILVTIIIQAEMQGLSLTECLESAYNVISKRTGKMVDGQFIKDVPKEMIPPVSGGVRTITDHVDFALKNQSNT